MHLKSSKPILLLEDDPTYGIEIRQAMNEADFMNRLEIVGSSEDALKYLRNSAHERPCLIILDLNMQRMNGLAFLKIIKEDIVLKKIPVVVLAASNDPQHRLDTFNLGITGYMLKPLEHQQLVALMKSINTYWANSELPPE